LDVENLLPVFLRVLGALSSLSHDNFSKLLTLSASLFNLIAPQSFSVHFPLVDQRRVYLTCAVQVLQLYICSAALSYTKQEPHPSLVQVAKDRLLQILHSLIVLTVEVGPHALGLFSSPFASERRSAAALLHFWAIWTATIRSLKEPVGDVLKKFLQTVPVTCNLQARGHTGSSLIVSSDETRLTRSITFEDTVMILGYQTMSEALQTQVSAQENHWELMKDVVSKTCDVGSTERLWALSFLLDELTRWWNAPHSVVPLQWTIVQALWNTIPIRTGHNSIHVEEFKANCDQMQSMDARDRKAPLAVMLNTTLANAAHLVAANEGRLSFKRFGILSMNQPLPIEQRMALAIQRLEQSLRLYMQRFCDKDVAKRRLASTCKRLLDAFSSDVRRATPVFYVAAAWTLLSLHVDSGNALLKLSNAFPRGLMSVSTRLLVWLLALEEPQLLLFASDQLQVLFEDILNDLLESISECVTASLVLDDTIAQGVSCTVSAVTVVVQCGSDWCRILTSAHFGKLYDLCAQCLEHKDVMIPHVVSTILLFLEDASGLSGTNFSIQLKECMWVVCSRALLNFLSVAIGMISAPSNDGLLRTEPWMFSAVDTCSNLCVSARESGAAWANEAFRGICIRLQPSVSWNSANVNLSFHVELECRFWQHVIYSDTFTAHVANTLGVVLCVWARACFCLRLDSQLRHGHQREDYSIRWSGVSQCFDVLVSRLAAQGRLTGVFSTVTQFPDVECNSSTSPAEALLLQRAAWFGHLCRSLGAGWHILRKDFAKISVAKQEIRTTLKGAEM
jgi:hypothetical protein